MKFRSALLTVFLVTLPAWGAGVDREKEPRTPPPRQQPWLWTLEQRLDLRFDPDSIRERSAAMDERNRKIMAESGESPRAVVSGRIDNVIDGARNPELLTPAELFHGLLFAFYDDAKTRNDIRNRVNHELYTLGVSDREFWDFLESSAGRYIDSFQSLTHGHPFTSAKELDDFCAMRFDALQAAREKFGQRAFDRLLYVSVAPRMIKGGEALLAPHPRRDPRSELQRQESGCR